MKIILGRHGNTFNPGETAVWVGSRNDLPLVETGIMQAKRLGNYLKTANIKPAAVYCGPLQRTTHYAAIVLAESGANIQPIIDQRLNEIDYGDWSGLTTEQICARFGREEVEAWEKYSRWPLHARWQGSEQSITEQIKSFCDEMLKKYQSDDTILIISSNGRLRYFLNMVEGGFSQQVEKQSFKVATGNICQIIYSHSHWQINYWNQVPS